MKKTGKCRRYKNPQGDEPQYIILNKYSQVFTGLIEGEPNWCDDVLQAKLLRGQSKFETLKRHSYLKIEQMFI